MNPFNPKIQSDDSSFASFKQNFEKLDETKIAWLAGLLQGEAAFQIDALPHPPEGEGGCFARERSKSNSPEYTPPPPTPVVKLEMIEKDLMECVGEYLGKPVKTMTRVTSAGNKVYRVSICARKEVELLLKRILPHVVGHKTRSKIEELLKICDQYNEWVSEGGKSKAAKLANKASQEAKKDKKDKKS
jgi:hypothetical protein